MAISKTITQSTGQSTNYNYISKIDWVPGPYRGITLYSGQWKDSTAFGLLQDADNVRADLPTSSSHTALTASTLQSYIDSGLINTGMSLEQAMIKICEKWLIDNVSDYSGGSQV